MSDSIFPPVDGRCGRCGAEDHGQTYCVTCWLPLRGGTAALAGRVGLAASAWRLANPDAYAEWERRAERVATTEHREACRRDFVYWHQRGMFAAHLLQEAQAKASDARDRCIREGISDDELRAAAGGAAGAELFPVQPANVPGAARVAGKGRGGFAFFYAESGPDLDGDGDVDGGLIDTVTDAGGGLLDGIGDLFG